MEQRVTILYTIKTLKKNQKVSLNNSSFFKSCSFSLVTGQTIAALLSDRVETGAKYVGVHKRQN